MSPWKPVRVVKCQQTSFENSSAANFIASCEMNIESWCTVERSSKQDSLRTNRKHYAHAFSSSVFNKRDSNQHHESRLNFKPPENHRERRHFPEKCEYSFHVGDVAINDKSVDSCVKFTGMSPAWSMWELDNQDNFVLLFRYNTVEVNRIQEIIWKTLSWTRTCALCGLMVFVASNNLTVITWTTRTMKSDHILRLYFKDCAH